MLVTDNNARTQKQRPKPGPEHELLDVITGKWSPDAVRTHLLEIAGDYAAARSTTGPRRTTSLPERHYLEACAVRLTDDRQDPTAPVEIDHLSPHERRAT